MKQPLQCVTVPRCREKVVKSQEDAAVGVTKGRAWHKGSMVYEVGTGQIM